MEIAKNVSGYRTFIANIAIISGLGKEKKDWILIDAGVPFSASMILNHTKKLFGSRKPLAILLTHAHFDHIGALPTLTKEWDVPIYIHEKEIPFLLGKYAYLPPTPMKVKGIMSFLSPLYPRDGLADLSANIRPITSISNIDFLEGWKWIHTPGHTKGHISLFREEDGVLLAGDALTTVKQESLFAVLTQRKEMHGPPAYFTPDRITAIESIEKLQKLEAKILYTGHGKPMYGAEINRGLKRLLRKEYETNYHTSFR